MIEFWMNERSNVNFYFQCDETAWIQITIEVTCAIRIRIETNADPKHRLANSKFGTWYCCYLVLLWKAVVLIAADTGVKIIKCA
jgi:hypothetical protein